MYRADAGDVYWVRKFDELKALHDRTWYREYLWVEKMGMRNQTSHVSKTLLNARDKILISHLCSPVVAQKLQASLSLSEKLQDRGNTGIARQD